MDFELSEEQKMFRDSVLSVANAFLLLICQTKNSMKRYSRRSRSR
jgi:hypothetical protein